jgi:type IV secretory pathway VirB4 component
LAYQTLIVDIEREYVRLTNLLEGQCLRFAPGTLHALNPFDLPHAQQVPPGEHTAEGHFDALAEKVSQLLALLDILLTEHTTQGGGRLTPFEKGLLDRALYECYREKGITSDPVTHHYSPPVLSDLARLLSNERCGRDTTGLADRLHRFVSGSLSSIFSGQTNVSLADKPVVCFDLQDLPAELRPIVLFLISTYVWNISFGSRIPRQFVVDELLTLYQYAEGKRFLETLFQRARKHYLSVCGITQYPKVLLESTIPSNCATSIVMAQELASLPLVQQVFQLSETEVQRVRTFGKGEALLLSNDQRFAVRFEASEQEYACSTSDPTDLIRFQDEGQMAASSSSEPPEVPWQEEAVLTRSAD